MPRNLFTALAIGLAAAVFFASPSAAQITVSASAKIKACDDFATLNLNDPWDMSNAQDVNNYLQSDITAIAANSFSGGVFDLDVTANNSGAFYLFSPQICGSHPVGGRWGQNLDIDTSKYSRFTVRMCTETPDPAGFRLIWNRSCDYVPNRTVTDAQPIRTGCHLYQVDLNSVAISGSDSSVVTPWSGGSITGFALQPTQIAQNVRVDYIRLEDPSTCGSASINYTANASGNDNLFSLYLDDDSDPSNGFLEQLVTAGAASGSSSVAASSIGLVPGSYKAVGVLDGDYALLERTDVWDMSQDTDIQLTAGISPASFSNGVYTGVATTGNPLIYLAVADGLIDASKYSKLSFKLDRDPGVSTSEFNIFWTTPSGAAFGAIVRPPTEADTDADEIYHVDLSGESGWSGTIKELIIRPVADNPGAVFALDWVSLRKSGFVTSPPSPSYVASSGSITVNSPPLFEILEPNLDGGVALRPWNMNSGDIVVTQNLDSGADPAFSGESLTSYLPDVRSVDGLRGDFFKGTNVSGNEDPNNYSTFPFFNDNPLTFDAAQYKNLCFKLNVERDTDLCLGSVGRVAHKTQGSADGDFIVSDDIVLIYDRWGSSKWYEYCVDMTELIAEPNGVPNWSGIKEAFRVDSHEFSRALCGADGVPTGDPIQVRYYFDYIKLRQDDTTTTGKFNIVYELSDSDDTAAVSFFASTSPSGTGSDISIGTASESADSKVITWDTSGVPNGTYYIYGIATDGTNQTGRFATGPVVVNNAGGAPANPVLSLERPASSEAICSTMQVRGYALQQDRLEDVATVEVLVDDDLIGTLEPSLFSLAARSAYPSVDASNSGFDGSFDVSGLSAGAHTVKIVAYSTDGGSTTQTVAVTKQGSGCPAATTDPDPSGAPVTVDAPAGTPTTDAPTITKVSLSKTGKLDLSIGQIGNTTCQVTVRTAATASGPFTDLKTFQIEDADVSIGIKKLQANNLKITKKKLSSFAIQIGKSCTGFQSASSEARTVNVRTKKGSIKSITALQNGLRSKLAKFKKTKKRKRRANRRRGRR